MNALERCVGDVDRFAREAWGRRVMVRDPLGDGFGDLLSLDDVDHLLSGYGLRTPTFRLVRDGQPLPVAEYTRSARLGGQPITGIADPARVFAAFDQGATIVLQGLQRFWPPLTRFCRDLEMALGHRCQVNAYVTPPGSRGFGEHSDAHDALVLQTFGSKAWQIWPAPGEDGDGGDGTARTVDMEPGAAVYMPTGTPHAARTQDSLSGHLTIGIHPTRWRELVEEAVSRSLDEAALEAPLPVGFHHHADTLAAQVQEHLDDVRARLDKLDVERVTGDVADRVFTGRSSWLRGGLVDRARLRTLDDQGRVRRRAGAACEIRSGEEALGMMRVLLGDREVRIPRWVEPAVRDIAEADELAVGDLAPHLDATSRLVLVRRLVREGLLEVADG